MTASLPSPTAEPSPRGRFAALARLGWRRLGTLPRPRPGESLETWRERILSTVLRATVWLGMVVYVPSVLAALRDELPAVIVGDTIGLVWVTVMARSRRMSYRSRSVQLIGLAYLLSVVLLVEVGPVSEIYLFSVSLFAAVLLGWRAALTTIALSAVTLMGFGALGLANVSFALRITGTALHQWTIVSLNFLFVNGVVAMALATLLEGLAGTIENERDAHASLAREQEELRASHARLREEIEGRRRAQESVARLVTAIEQLADGVAIADSDGEFLYRNPAFVQLAEKSGRTLGANLGALVAALDTGSASTADPGPAASGEIRTGTIVGQHGQDTVGALELDVKISPIRAPDDAAVGSIVVLSDVSHEREVELRLRRSQKLEAIGTLAGGIAHDFNNILVAILGFTEISLDSLPSESPIRGDLTSVLQAAQRARDLVRQILTFSRQVEDVRRPIEIRPVVNEALNLLRASLPSTIEIARTFDRDVGRVVADPTQLHQVVMNLCTNAFHAMDPQGGTLSVSLDRVKTDVDGAHEGTRLMPGTEYVRLTVADTGCGMDRATLERIFDPFFTTKERGRGTGLGLPTVLGIVTGCGGDVTVYSEPGKGTTFRVYLPRVSTQAEHAAETRPAAPRGRGERILFVDDEPSIRLFGERILTKLGYHVESAANGRKALERLSDGGAPIVLVVTDQTMPEMTGLELAEAMRRGHLSQPVILTSGLGEMMSADVVATAGVRAFLQKPFVIADLALSVRQALDTVVRAT